MNTDPGWRQILRHPSNLLLPQLALARMGRQGASPILVARELFCAFILAVYVYMPFVLAFLFDDWTDIATTHAAALGALSVGAFLAHSNVSGDRLGGNDSPGGFRARFPQ